MKKNNHKRKNQIFLVLFLMILTLTANAGTYSGGAGTSLSPYLISTPADLVELQNTFADFAKYFKMTNNIDMTGVTFYGIGNGSTSDNLQDRSFMGTFDGNNFEIQNLTISDFYTAAAANGIALFTNVNSATIKNLGLKNVSAVYTNNERVAGIGGYVYGGSSISNCYVDGGTFQGTYRVAAIAGWLTGTSTVTNCWANTSNTCGIAGQTWHYVGGIVGTSDGTSVITNCTFYGTLAGIVVGNTKGGITGVIIPTSTATCVNSYYINTCGDTKNIAGTTSKTPAELASSATYTGFDFTNIWKMDTYAKLKSFYVKSVSANTNLSSLTTTAKSDVVVSNNAVLTVDATSTIDNLTIEPGAKVTNANGNTLTVTNNITINSDATNGTGTYIEADGSSLVGVTANVNQNFQNLYRSWYMSSPAATAAPTGMNRIKYYNEADNTWPLFSTGTMEVGKGYLVVPDNDDAAVLFSGALNTGNKTITLARTTNAPKAGFNLIGNPYPSYLNWQSVYAANSAKLEYNSIWYRTKSGSYTFWTVNGSTGIGSPLEASNLIPPTQAFWVKALTDGSQLNLTNAMREHAPATNKLLKAPAVNVSETSLLRLQVNDGSTTDEAVLYFSANSTEGMDATDSPKMPNDDETVPEIYTTIGNEKIVINGMNAIPMDEEIGLGFKASTATSFSLKANELKNIPSDVKVILKDNITTDETDLTDGQTLYNFSPLATTTNRFSIIFRSNSATTKIKNTNIDNSVLVYSAVQSKITVVNKSINAEILVAVYNSVGQKLMSQKLSQSTQMLDGNFKTGIYFVKYNNATKKVNVR